MSVFGVGIVLTPWKLATAESSIQRFRLPPASVHIPHGNFAASIPEKLRIEEFDFSISRHHFMHNGIEVSEKDLTVISIRKNDELANVCISNNTASVTGFISHTNIKTNSHFIQLNTKGFKLNLDLRYNLVELIRS